MAEAAGFCRDFGIGVADTGEPGFGIVQRGIQVFVFDDDIEVHDAALAGFGVGIEYMREGHNILHDHVRKKSGAENAPEQPDGF